MTKRADNGPTFTKATYDRKRLRFDPPSSARQQAQLEQDMRDAADKKLLATDPKAWLRKLGLIKD